MKKLLTILLICPLLALAQLGDQTIINVTVGGGVTQKAILHLPNDYASTSTRYPLFIFVHGADEAGTDPAEIYNSPTAGGPAYFIGHGQWPETFINPADGLPYKFIVLSPQYASSANPTSGVQLDSLIGLMEKTYRVDTTRVYLSGLSDGGIGLCEHFGRILTTGVAFNRHHKVAAVIPMSAVMNANLRSAWAVNIGADVIYALMFGSLSDTHGVNTQGFDYIINNKNPSFNPKLSRFIQYTGGHCCWGGFYTPTYKTTIDGKNVNIYEWGLQYTQSGSTPPPPPLPPVVTTFSPTSGSPGTAVTITGTDFSGVSSVTFGGTAAASYTVNSTTSITAIVGSGSSGSVAVTTASGTGSRAGFTYSAPAVPTVSSFSPTSGTTGGSITITGTNFTSVSAVTFGGTPAASFVVNSSTNITATVGAGSSGSVSITTSGGTGSKGGFTYSAPPPPVDNHHIVHVTVSEYKAGYITVDSNWWGMYYDNGLKRTVMKKYNVNGRKVIKGYGGLYNSIAIDDQGYVWVSNNNDTLGARVNVDTLGAAFSGNTDVAAFNFSYFAIRPDGTIWGWGINQYKLNGTDATKNWRFPSKVPGQAGVQFKKIRVSQTELIGLSTTGDIYEWATGATAPVKRTLPGIVTDFDAGYRDFFVALIGGHPYGWGNGPYLGLTGTVSTAVDLRNVWGITQNVNKVACNQNGLHFILADGTLWGMGDQTMGEVGNGIEFVNKFEYPNPYIWSWKPAENMLTAPVQISIGNTFKDIFSGQSSAFYWYALGTNDSIYFWGRSKSKVSGGAWVGAQTVAPAAANENTYPNFSDVLTPISIDPFKTVWDNENFVPGQTHAGSDQNIVGSTCTLSGSATPSTFFTITGYRWRNLSGGNAVITSPSAAATTVTGLDQGTYRFEFMAQDNNNGTYADTVQVTVTSTPNISPTVTLPEDTTINLPADSISITGTATDPDGTVASYLWTKTSGPSCSIVSHTNRTTKIRGLSAGTYVFRLAATDNDGGTGFADISVTVLPTTPTTTIEVRIRKGTNVLIISDN